VTISTFQRRLSPQHFARRLPCVLQSREEVDKLEGEIVEIEETVERGLVHPADMREGTRRQVALLVNSLLTSGADTVVMELHRKDVVMEDHRKDVDMVAMEVPLEGLDVEGASSAVAPTGEIHPQALEIGSQVVAMEVIVNKAEVVLEEIVNKEEVALVEIVNKAEVATEGIVNKVEVEVGLEAVLAVAGQGADLHPPSKLNL